MNAIESIHLPVTTQVVNDAVPKNSIINNLWNGLLLLDIYYCF